MCAQILLKGLLRSKTVHSGQQENIYEADRRQQRDMVSNHDSCEYCVCVCVCHRYFGEHSPSNCNLICDVPTGHGQHWIGDCSRYLCIFFHKS